MADAPILQLQQPPQPQQQQAMMIPEDECVAEASGSAAAWGTLEELFLASAVGRHGTEDWSAVAGELQSRAKILNSSSACYSSEACKSKFEALNGRYSYRNGTNAREKEGDNFPPWIEEVRKRRVAHLKRELERHDGSIILLTNKLKKLKAERAQSLQTGNSKQQQQHAPEKSGFEPVKAPDSSTPIVADVSAGEPVAREAEAPDDGSGTLITSREEKVAAVDEEEKTLGVSSPSDQRVEEAKPAYGVEEMKDVDTKENTEGILDRNVDTGKRVEVISSDREADNGGLNTTTATGEELVCMKNEAVDDGSEDGKSESSDAKASEEKPAPQVKDEEDNKAGGEKGGENGEAGDAEKNPESKLEQGEKPSSGDGDQPGSAERGSGEAIKAGDGDFVEPASGADEASPKDDEDKPGLTPPEPDLKPVDETGQLVVHIVGEQASVLEEKSSSDGGGAPAQAAAELKEKSDESQGGGNRQQDSAEKVDDDSPPKPSAQQDDVGSPASVNEASGDQSKDSQVERSDVGSQADGIEDTSPTSSRSKKEIKLSGKLQPLLDCLMTIYNHKLASYFKHKLQEERYDQIVRRHVDLNMIKARLEEGAYSGGQEFFRDTLLVFNNNIVYYSRDSQEHGAAVTLRKMVLDEMDKFLQAETGIKHDRPVTTGWKQAAPVENPQPASSTPAVVAAAAPPLAARSKARQPLNLNPVAPASGATLAQVSTSENSKSKSASLVPSSRGGEDDREGEPEVEGRSKPLKAYGRKNRSAGAAAAAGASGDQKTGIAKAGTREKALEAIVKKIGGKAEDSTPAPAPTPAAPAAPAPAASAPASTPAPAPASSKEKDKEKKGKDKGKEKAEATKGSDSKAGAKSKAAAASGAASDNILPPGSTPVRGVRNKRSAAKDQRPASAAKRSRR